MQFNNNKTRLLSLTYTLTVTLIFYLLSSQTQCIHVCDHDIHVHNTTKHFYNDLIYKNKQNNRNLQASQNGKIRIFVDYTQITIGGTTQINTIKRVMNITASYFYNVLTVPRLNRLLFPKNASLQCNTLKVPQQYTTDGTVGDYGVLCGNQQKQDVSYIAKSASCAYLLSNNRPIWGMISFNNVFLKYDQQGFQQILFVGIHQMTHLLGFSASMFQMYPTGNPLIADNVTGTFYLKTPRIMQEINNYYGCSGQLAKGLPLQDQDGTLIASHWQKKVIGNQYMIASNKKSAFVSRFTLALLQSTGWYISVNYSYAQSNTWGKDKGCTFLNIDNCDSQQFCNDNQFGCDWDGTGIGRCALDTFSGSCMVIKYFINTICIDQNYQLKNLNSNLNAMERGGSNSRCFQSNFRQEGMQMNLLNNRCYITVCSASKKFLYILIGSYVMVCTKQGIDIPAPPGLAGTLKCPRNFKNYCQSKKQCPYHCNKNGACIDGQCLCTGQTFLSRTCIDVSILKAPIGTVGGLLNAFNDISPSLSSHILISQGIPPGLANRVSDVTLPQQDIKTYSIDSKCLQGSAYDRIFGECIKCQDIYGCENCNDAGCVSCDDGKAPTNGRC